MFVCQYVNVPLVNVNTTPMRWVISDERRITEEGRRNVAHACMPQEPNPLHLVVVAPPPPTRTSCNHKIGSVVAH